jgi:3-methylcrotonyl-CoA carboxylase alpha subunit
MKYRLLDSCHIEINGRRHRFYVIHRRDVSIVWLDGRTYHVPRARNAASAREASASGTGEVRALMPGKLLRLEVAIGDTVAEKQTVAIMESMKMETALVSPKAGRVSEIRFAAGDVLEMGEVVVVIV